MSEIDQQLEDMRLAHRAFARYTIYLTKANFEKGRTIIDTGLTYDVAIARREELNATLEPRRFGDPMYGVEMERDYSQSARPFWHTVGHGLDSAPNAMFDLAEWETISVVQPECVCQVLWRARGEHQFRTKNFLARPDAAKFIREKMTELDSNLYDIGVTPKQPARHTELANEASAMAAPQEPASIQ